MPCISVLVPVHNAQSTLDQALGSIAAQSYPEWEMLVVDDGSTDDSLRLLRAWERRDRRIRLISLPARQGIVEALNHALSEARGEFVARMDADDVSLPRRFERQLEFMTSRAVDAVGCRVRYFPDDLVQEGARRYEGWLNQLCGPVQHSLALFVECPLAHPTLMIRTEALRRLGGYVDRGWPEDYDLLLRLWAAGGRVDKVPEELLLWREGALRSSRTLEMYAPDAFRRCKAHYLRSTYLKDKPALIFGAGPIGKAMARCVAETGAEVCGFVDLDPRRIGQTIHGKRVFPRQVGLALRGRAFGLAAVGRPGAREELAGVIRDAGWVEGEDFVSVA